MNIFDKITSITHFYDNSSKEKVEEYILPPEKEKEMRNLIAASSKDLRPWPNDDVEFIVPLFNARKYYKKLKRMLWKYGKIR